jgi:hypothetical protein
MDRGLEPGVASATRGVSGIGRDIMRLPAQTLRWTDFEPLQPLLRLHLEGRVLRDLHEWTAR